MLHSGESESVNMNRRIINEKRISQYREVLFFISSFLCFSVVLTDALHIFLHAFLHILLYVFYMPFCISFCMSFTYLSAYLSVYLSVCLEMAYSLIVTAGLQIYLLGCSPGI